MAIYFIPFIPSPSYTYIHSFIHLLIHSIVVGQFHILSQIEFSTQCGLVLSVSIYSTSRFLKDIQ